VYGRRLVLVLVLALLAVASESAVPGDTSAAPQVVNQTCLKASSGLVSSLKGGLKAKARGRLGTPRVVKSRGQLSGFSPRGFRAGVYFVSAKVRGFGIATWAADASAYRTGGGFIVGIGPVTRRVSVAGIDIPASTLTGWGADDEHARLHRVPALRPVELVVLADQEPLRHPEHVLASSGQRR
jgi:hypothetical protein